MFPIEISKKIAAAVMVIIGIAIIAAVTWYVAWRPMPENMPTDNATQNADADNQEGNDNVATSTTAEIDTSDWKTYRNEEWEFAVKYPQTSNVVQKHKSLVIDYETTTLLINTLDSVISEDQALQSMMEGKYYRESPFYISPEQWQRQQDMYNKKTSDERCKMEGAYLICYRFHLNSNSFTRYDIRYHKGVRYTYVTPLNKGVDTTLTDDTAIQESAHAQIQMWLQEKKEVLPVLNMLHRAKAVFTVL